MVFNRLWRLAAVMLLALAGAAGFAATAQAAEDCTSIVIDDAGVFGSGFDEVEEAAGRLMTTGADVRVRTIASIGNNANIDGYIDEVRDNCPSWQGPSGPGDWKRNMIVLAVAMDVREIVIQTGEHGQWAEPLLDNGAAQSIQGDIGSFLGDARFADGFVFGLNEVRERIDNFQNPPPAPQTGGNTTETNIDIDFAGIGWVLLWIVGIVGVIVLGFLLFAALQQSREKRDERETARQRALSARDAATEITNELGRQSQKDLRSSRVTSYAGLIDPRTSELEAALVEFNSRYRAATNEVHAAASAGGDADFENHPTGVYNQLAERYERALEHARAAKDADNEISVLAAKLNDDLNSLGDDIGSARLRLDSVRSSIDSAQAVFEQIVSGNPESVWEPVQGNGTEATNRAAVAEELISEAANVDMADRQQQFDALEAVGEANRLLGEAESLLHSVTELKQNIDEARRTAPSEIVAAQLDIDKAAQYISDHVEDVTEEDLEDDLRRAEETLAQAEDEKAKAQPDYLRVVELALAANRSADRILALAQEERQAAVRLRQIAATTLKSAKAEVSKAKEFIEDHKSDVKYEAEQQLKDAQQKLKLANQAEDPADVLDYAGDALELAQSAYKNAKDDFKQAERDRRPVYTPSYTTARLSRTYGSPSYNSPSYSRPGLGGGLSAGAGTNWGISIGGGASGGSSSKF